MAKQTLMILALVLVACACLSSASCKAIDVSKLQEGDIIFMESKSQQSPVIKIAQQSRWTHCGIIFFDGGKPYVYEAIEPVCRTSLDKWIARGKNSDVLVERLKKPLSKEDVKDMKGVAKSMLGRHYDKCFTMDDERLYCSELVWKAYKYGASVQLCEPTSLSKMGLDNAVVRLFASKKIGKARVAKIKGDEPIVTPAQIARSRKLKRIF